MKRYIDLHIHSTNSDGSWTPAKIIERAIKYELAAISITDHDTVSGIPEALESIRNTGIDFVPGIEISTKWCHGRMHILGYFIDHNSPYLAELSRKMTLARSERITETCEKLAAIGKPVPIELVLEMAGNSSSIGRPHIANAMVKLGYVPTLQKAFNLYLSYGKPGYVPRWSPEPKEAIDIIHGAGGIAVVAHCGVTEGCVEQLDKVIALGIDGIEVLRQVKKSKPDIEVIILTGHGSEADRKLCMELGAFAYLQKPVDIDVLSNTLKQANEKVQQRKQAAE